MRFRKKIKISLILGVSFLILFLLFGCIQQGITETPIQENEEKLELEYLYAEGCEEFCPQATLIVNDIAGEFSKEVLTITYINLTERHTNPEIMKIHELYKDTGKIQGVPAYALHKNNKTYFHTGLLQKSSLINWICQYYDKTPEKCN